MLKDLRKAYDKTYKLRELYIVSDFAFFIKEEALVHFHTY